MPRRPPTTAALKLGLTLAAAAASLTLTLSTTVASGAPHTGIPATAPRLAVPSPGCGRQATHRPVALGASQPVSLHQGSISGQYILSVPRHDRARHPVPLILLFHGDGDAPSDFVAKTDLPAQAAAAGDLVATPQNQGPEPGFQYTAHGSDGAFVTALIGALERAYCVNERAVFTTGFSSGAAFAILYACAHQSQIRGMATVAVDYLMGCTRPEPILAFHGTDDPAVTYGDNTIASQLPGITLDAGEVRGTVQNMHDWAALDHCAPTPTVTPVASQVEESHFHGCASGTSVTFYTVMGGGHAWPSANPPLGYGFSTNAISATKLIVAYVGALAVSR